MISNYDIRAMADYMPYWREAKPCDFCGQHTRGRIYEDEPDVVWCGSCRKPLVGNPVRVTAENFPLPSTQLNWGEKD